MLGFARIAAAQKPRPCIAKVMWVGVGIAHWGMMEIRPARTNEIKLSFF